MPGRPGHGTAGAGIRPVRVPVPTMADLSGASVLDGTGVYARTLHTVHRI